MSKILRIACVCLLPVMASSCTGWPRGWAKARGSAPADALSGAWLGTWRSEPSGHQGKLRCAVIPKGGGVWEYRYRATWAGFLCAGFTLDCRAVSEKDGQWKVTGEKNLGPVFGGVFTHRASVKDGEMKATYSAKLDHGVMELRRVGKPDAGP